MMQKQVEVLNGSYSVLLWPSRRENVFACVSRTSSKSQNAPAADSKLNSRRNRKKRSCECLFQHPPPETGSAYCCACQRRRRSLGTMEQPATPFLVELLHSVPHINITLHRVNDTFNPSSTVYIESLYL
ncbi:hypothetical protein pipiens_010452 [Culex pipiens pipiens]|uniref:Uncharacterized protein n=1 Tax=Culex pipiens pipiens TaxID=38569 RepID=A0ABD1DA52_CULPP